MLNLSSLHPGRQSKLTPLLLGEPAQSDDAKSDSCWSFRSVGRELRARGGVCLEEACSFLVLPRGHLASGKVGQWRVWSASLSEV